MTERDFTYWLQGFMELANPKTITVKQTTIIKNHLNLVFNKLTPKVVDEVFCSNRGNFNFMRNDYTHTPPASC